MNPVTVAGTFHVGQFLEDIVGIATTRGDMSATFPTKATENQAQQRVEHSAWCRPSNTVIKVLLDSGPDGDIMFQKEDPDIPPT